MKKSAVISECGKYRYQLERTWDKTKPKVMFIMLNPSTADANEDDPTIRRCIGFAKLWGFGGIYVGNLFAYRSTKPKGLLHAENPTGPDNKEHLIKMSKKCVKVVCAWGNSSIVNKLKPSHFLLSGIKIPFHYIELCKDGTPKHPLYLKYTPFSIPY